MHTARLQVSHQQEMARYGHVKTTAELQNMVTALQKEVDTHAGHARKAAVSLGQLPGSCCVSH